jgi:DNA-binding NarL/FixJ family response regulator
MAKASGRGQTRDAWVCSATGNLAHVKCILIVDDSPEIRRCLRTLLEEQTGWAVCGEATNGLEGIEKAEQLHPDLIVLDLSMPVMNGLQAARRLKQLMPAVPLVMFTNHAADSLMSEALEAGIVSVKDKSEGVDTLVSSIRRLLEAPPADGWAKTG